MPSEQEQYNEISQTLLISEAATLFQIGFPLILPISKSRTLADCYHGPLDEFIRISLLGVPSSLLELYCSELEAPTSSQPANELENLSLGLTMPGKVERWGGLAVLSCCLGTIPALVAGLLVSFPLWCAPALFLLSASAFSALLSPQYTKKSRLLSFHIHLYNELLRRRGGGPMRAKGLLSLFRTPRARLAELKTETSLSRRGN